MVKLRKDKNYYRFLFWFVLIVSLIYVFCFIFGFNEYQTKVKLEKQACMELLKVSTGLYQTCLNECNLTSGEIRDKWLKIKLEDMIERG